MQLFGKNWDRRGLLAHVGDLRQIGGAQPVVLDDGPERGVRAIEVRTGTGFAFWLLPDRGLDVYRADFQGASLAWLSPTGPTAPAFFEPEGLGWLRGFYGGMVTTCGLSYAGPPHRDGTKDLGLHGRASYTPASEVALLQDWKGDEYEIRVRGRIREASVFGEHLVLTREIRTRLGENRLWIEDEVENVGFDPSPLMLLYHVNAGFPVVTADSELLAPTAEAKPRDAEAEKEKERWNHSLPPTPGFAERVYFHELRAGKDGRATVAVVNRGFLGGRGLGYALRFPLDACPCFTEWKMMGQGTYVLGTEPGNVSPLAREQLRREGRLPMLAPGEKRRFGLELQVLTSPEDIRAVEEEIATC
ncbi:aldose 1-epimerase family protein [Archangium sp.]|uniref:aldose 1-epimerase family protein n=1 Tax=Archangium sp. TaxID=1872627 RepID=UPI002D6858B6|nr:aldose 1-epimerase family protein [Archangium sp.]HYO56173.1 aldose 1-epimerase family protein [Archangium sp.]